MYNTFILSVSAHTDVHQLPRQLEGRYFASVAAPAFVHAQLMSPDVAFTVGVKVAEASLLALVPLTVMAPVVGAYVMTTHSFVAPVLAVRPS